MYGHIFHGVVSEIIFIFHMPLFFFLSGFFFRAAETKKYLVKKTIHLILPYFSYLLLFLFLALAKDLARGQSLSFQGLADRLAKMFYGGVQLGGVTGPLWFLTCLFFTQQAYNTIVRYSRSTVWLITLTCYIIGMIVSFYSDFNLPMAIEVVLISTMYFHLGYLFKQAKIPITDKSVVVMFLIGTTGVILVTLGFDVSVDMKNSDYGMPIANIVFPVAFILLTFKISEFLSRFRLALKVIGIFGGASLTILCLHQFFHVILAPVVNLENETFALFCSASVGSLLVHQILIRIPLSRLCLLGVPQRKP